MKCALLHYTSCWVFDTITKLAWSLWIPRYLQVTKNRDSTLKIKEHWTTKRLFYTDFYSFQNFSQRVGTIISQGTIHKLCNAFSTVFDHQPTYGNVLAVILLMKYHTRPFNSDTFVGNLPNPTVLRNLWMAHKKILLCNQMTWIEVATKSTI